MKFHYKCKGEYSHPSFILNLRGQPDLEEGTGEIVQRRYPALGQLGYQASGVSCLLGENVLVDKEEWPSHHHDS